MSALLVAIGVVLLACLLTWTVVVSLKLWETGTPDSYIRESVIVRREAARAGLVLPVGVREIREDQVYGDDSGLASPYEYDPVGPTGVPAPWLDDVWLRRN